MKIRIGFVSNSSSSSFLCLGTSNSKSIGQLLKAENPKYHRDGEWKIYDEEWGGALTGKNINFYGYRGEPDRENDGFEVAGLDDSETKRILENHSLKEAREIFRKLIKDRLGVDIPIKDIDLISGECSSE